MIFATWSQFRAGFMPGAPIGIDGVETWDSAMVDQAGFANSLTFPQFVSFPYDIEVDAGPDAVPGTDEYSWYLSQRTDVVANQYFEVQRNDTNSPVVTNSGRIRIVRTALAATLYPTVTTIALIAMFKDLDLYVYRVSDGLIQHRLLEDVIFQ